MLLMHKSLAKTCLTRFKRFCQKTYTPATRVLDNQEAVFSSYKVPVLKIDREKRQAKEEWSKKQETKKKRRVSAKALPYFSKERAYERELKIVAVDES